MDEMQPATRPQRVWKRRPDAVWRRSSGQIVVLLAESNEPHLLSGAADLLWDLLEDPRTEDELVTLAAELTNEMPTAVRSDILRFLSELEDVGIAIRSDAPTGRPAPDVPSRSQTNRNDR